MIIRRLCLSRSATQLRLRTFPAMITISTCSLRPMWNRATTNQRSLGVLTAFVSRLLGAFFIAFIPLTALQAQNNYATPYTFSTFAGTAGHGGSSDGTGSAAQFGSPYGVALDGLGNVYVADTGNHAIRKITAAGVVATLASLPPLPNISFESAPIGVAVDGAGNVYVAESNNNRIQKITPAGVVTTLAGNTARNPDLPRIPGVFGTIPDPSNAGSADGSASTARFHTPQGLAVDSAGYVYVADWGNNTIRKITPTGVVTTLAGTAGIATTGINMDGTGSAAHFWGPAGVAVDGAGNVYIAESANNLIRKITPGAVVTTLAGTSTLSGSIDGTGSAARFSFPTGVAADGSGNVYVAEASNYLIRKITAAGVVTTLAGTARSSGSTDGTGSAALFYSPNGVAVNAAGNVYVADTSNNTIRMGVPLVATAPAITTQPASQTVSEDNSVTFTATASGTPAPTFQWQKDSINLSGATSGSYTIANATATDAGNYTVIATSSVGSATSNAAVLTVIIAPGNAVVTITVE